MCGFLWLCDALKVSPLFIFFHSAANRSNVRCSQTLELLFIFLFRVSFSASSAKPEPVRRENARKGSVVNVNPTNIRPQSDSPEIRKYKKKFNSEVLCAALWGKLRSAWACVLREGSSRRGWRYMAVRFRSCITPLLSENPENIPTCHSHGIAFLTEDGKQMSYSCKGFCASE